MNQETKNNLKIITLLLVVFIILYALHITFGDRFEHEKQSNNHMEDITLIFHTDYENNILTVEGIYPEEVNFYWSEIEIASGYATFDQYDVIEIGHTLSNCTDHLQLKFIPSGIIIWDTDFR